MEEKNLIYTKVGVTIPVDNASIDCVIATEILEHCSFPDIIIKEICRVLKPQGKLVFTTPFLWPLHEIPDDAFRYTPFTPERLLMAVLLIKILKWIDRKPVDYCESYMITGLSGVAVKKKI